ncbi:hypothetical protein BST81_15840 [Leptolyngbya sp. 'hensonii']|uniref:hypothetical protein n=1 Tax=Leptolyngbya sp. 'hensonii' TaxID=1922337 RepID=UPI00094FE873|nr:hypothetical protein [Leptolyngbya sp. 'hensonii']OLP17288.1 hypothetical protein BST81_15840 [Leptolyngbya sp. 'hensonii']
MENRIQPQIAKVWQSLTDPSVLDTYRQTVAVTWKLLKELVLLVWLLLCLVLVLGDWFWANSILAGRNFRDWLNSRKEVDSQELASNAGKALLNAGVSSVFSIMATARNQVGLEGEPQVATLLQESEAEAPTAPPAKPASPSVATKPPVVPSAPPVPPPASSGDSDA